MTATAMGHHPLSDDDCRSSSGPPATTQGTATSPGNFRRLPSQTWSQIMAGNQHTHPWRRSQPRPRAHYRDRHEDNYIFDVRMATKDSASTTRNEPDNPTYWHQPLTPTSFANPKPTTLTSAQIGLWRHTGLHWYAQGGNHRPRNAPTASTPSNNPQYRVHGRKPPQPSRTIHHPTPLAPIRPERTRLGHLHRRPSATPTHTLPVSTTAPATNSQQQFTVPQSIQSRTSAAPHQPPARAHVNDPRRVQLIKPHQPPARAHVNGGYNSSNLYGKCWELSIPMPVT